ncbi:hypothetical protein KM043_018219 [Ampulex compressa]|nr:hypothetical protein KM043_018219 [Ampulex compressa]
MDEMPYEPAVEPRPEEYLEPYHLLGGVTDVTSLSKAIHEVEGQGEQTPKNPLDAFYPLKEMYCLGP